MEVLFIHFVLLVVQLVLPLASLFRNRNAQIRRGSDPRTESLRYIVYIGWTGIHVEWMQRRNAKRKVRLFSQ